MSDSDWRFVGYVGNERLRCKLLVWLQTRFDVTVRQCKDSVGGDNYYLEVKGKETAKAKLAFRGYYGCFYDSAFGYLLS